MEPRMRPANALCPGQDVGLRHGWTAPHPGGRDLLRRSVNFSSAACQFFFDDLSFLTVPTSPCQIVECGLDALGMTVVSYVIWGMSGRGYRGTGHRNHELENHDDEITTDPRVLRNVHRGCVRFDFSRRSRCERPTDSGPDADEGPGPDAS